MGELSMHQVFDCSFEPRRFIYDDSALHVVRERLVDLIAERCSDPDARSSFVVEESSGSGIELTVSSRIETAAIDVRGLDLLRQSQIEKVRSFVRDARSVADGWLDSFPKGPLRDDPEVAALSLAYREHYRRNSYTTNPLGLDIDDERPLRSIVRFAIPHEVACSVAVRDDIESLVADAVDRRNGITPSDLEPVVVALAPDRRDHLVVSGEGTSAFRVADALLAPPPIPSPRPRVIDEWPPSTTPYWASASLVLAAVAVSTSWVPVSWASLLAVGAVLVAVVALTVWRGAHDGVVVRRLWLGLAPVTVIWSFALFFGARMLGDSPAVVVPLSPPHLVDAFLVSFGLGSTAGLFDMSLRSLDVRVAALVEILLLVGVAGSSLAAAARSVLRRMRQLQQPAERG